MLIKSFSLEIHLNQYSIIKWYLWQSILFLYLIQANCGDSRAVASVGGKVEELSFDHKPSNEGMEIQHVCLS